MAKATKTAKVSAVSFAEWKCEVVNGKPEKLKIVRPCVKITKEEADVLNDGRIGSGNKIVNLFFANEAKGKEADDNQGQNGE